MSEIFLKLRNNIVLESDLLLAEREIKALFIDCEPINTKDGKLFKSIPQSVIISNIKPCGVIGYKVANNKISVNKIIERLSFIQEIWSDTCLCELDKGYSTQAFGCYCYIPLMAMSEILYYTKTPSIETAERIVKVLAFHEDKDKEIKGAINRIKTSAHHIHSFHAYKAKFFPRFVRSLIVSYCNNDKDSLSICDPFVGSGTTLIESSLMGFNSYGIDIDPLSCFISKVKSDTLNIQNNEIAMFDYNNFCSEEGVNSYTFPYDIEKKFKRWDKLDEMNEYENEISMILNYIDTIHSPQKDLLKIALSDALTRKFNIRMMGTGSGRFALEIGKTQLSTIIKSDIVNFIKGIKTVNTIKSIYKLTTPTPAVTNGNATQRSVADNSFDLIITSPPYIPASSGREDYLVGKMISLKAMGLYNDDNVDFCKKNSVGSMNVESDELAEMPNEVNDLYNWLLNDELRCVKAKPIIAYYKSILSSLKEDARTIRDDGKIIYIIGKETVFYSSSTKEVLYRVECDKIFSRIATQANLVVEEIIDIELDKKDNIARPRGTDKYYECAIIMKKA